MDIDLGRREKLWLALGTVILLPLILFRFVLSPVNEHLLKMEQKITDTKNKIHQMTLLGQELVYLKRIQNTTSLSLRRKVDSILRKLNLKKKATLTTEENPDGNQKLLLKLKGVNLTELSSTIYQIENSKPVILINKMDISRSYKNNKLFRVFVYLHSK